eukprot:4277711-Pyramimonas_sp.AAC.1
MRGPEPAGPAKLSLGERGTPSPTLGAAGRGRNWGTREQEREATRKKQGGTKHHLNRGGDCVFALLMSALVVPA